MKTMREMCEETKVCAIMRNVPLEETRNYAKAAFDGGIRMFEIAMNSSDGAKQIAMLREMFGEKAYVGAGTVTEQKRCVAARDAGAQFFLTPSVVITTLEYCREYDIPLLPGVMTPTDVSICLAYGYQTMKLFPAGDMPASYIKSLKGPFDGTEYVAVGGVSLSNTADYLKQGFIGVGIGGKLIPAKYMKDGAWESAAREIKEAMDQIAEIV